MTTEHDELHAEREAVWVLGQFRLHLTEVPPFSEALTALIEKAKLIGARDALLAYGKKYEPSGPHGAFIEYTIRHAIGTRSL